MEELQWNKYLTAVQTACSLKHLEGSQMILYHVFRFLFVSRVDLKRQNAAVQNTHDATERGGMLVQRDYYLTFVRRCYYFYCAVTRMEMQHKMYMRTRTRVCFPVNASGRLCQAGQLARTDTHPGCVCLLLMAICVFDLFCNIDL